MPTSTDELLNKNMFKKKKTRLTKFYYKNSQKKEDQEKLEAKAVYCPEQILKAKND